MKKKPEKVDFVVRSVEKQHVDWIDANYREYNMTKGEFLSELINTAREAIDAREQVLEKNKRSS